MSDNNKNKPPKNNNSPYIRIYFATQAEKDLVQDAAKELGMTDSAFCRTAIQNEIDFIESEKSE